MLASILLASLYTQGDSSINIFSVLICTYQPDHFLFEQVDSISNSIVTEKQVHIYIFDDTQSPNVRIECLRESKNKGIKVLPGARSGSASDNFIYSLLRVKSDWVFLSDQDDIWEKEKFSDYLKVISCLDEEKPQIIFSDSSLIDEGGRFIHSSFFKFQGLTDAVLNNDDILFKNCVQGATLCLNRSMIDLLRDSLQGEELSNIAMHDWWIAILARYCGNWTFINKPLLRYRQHDRNVVGAIEKSNILVKFFKNPFIYYRKLKTLKTQYQLWLRVSKRLKERSSFNSKKMDISWLSKCKLLVISLMP